VPVVLPFILFSHHVDVHVKPIIPHKNLKTMYMGREQCSSVATYSKMYTSVGLSESLSVAADNISVSFCDEEHSVLLYCTHSVQY